ncbi:hypothetical protein [Microbacterium terrisoli]|jgi:hypothetical protein|uniref:hypothetical protein n=1 Tax=Microbacterium terrisoli TaxID=3242192 RepID=UPI002803B9CF|nr:hypothetical protein [Microbacterium protaetiae]
MQSGVVRGVIVVGVGVVLAAWIAFGRALFGIAGDLTAVYALTLAPLLVVLHLFIGQGVVRTQRRGFRHRRATFGTLYASWGCAVMLGLLIPDMTPGGLQTIATGASEPGRGIAIGFANPLGVIMIVFAVAALVLARGDAHGRADAPSEDELY